MLSGVDGRYAIEVLEGTVRQRIRSFYAGDKGAVTWLVDAICLWARIRTHYDGDILAYAFTESIGGPTYKWKSSPWPSDRVTLWAFIYHFRRLFLALLLVVAFLIALISLVPRLDAPTMWGAVRPNAVPSSSPFGGTPQGPGSSPYVAYLGASEMRAMAHERQRHPYAVATSSPERVTSTPATVVALIRAAAAEFRQDADAMVAVGHCESTLNPLAVGKAGERGVFQFLPSTWRANAARLGYGEEDVWDPRAAARVTAEMWSRHQQWQWSCWKGG